MSKYVIIGNSTAGIAAAEAIRKKDKKGSLTIISEEKGPAYGRPLISYYLQGVTNDETLPYRPDDFYKKLNIDLKDGVKAKKIDAESKKVYLSDGKTVSYDKLLVATGSVPFVPPTPGLDSVREKFTFYTIEDARKLKAALNPDTRLLIIGAGLIGLKCMEGAYDITRNITVIDLADRVLSSVLDEECADPVQRKIEEKGVKLVLKDKVKEFYENYCVTDGGLKIEFDAVVTAVGVKPNVALIADAGGKINRGIVTDLKQRTSLPDVYAAGDCTVSFDASSGTEKVMAVLPNAYFQGEVAGYNMAGEDREICNLLPLNSIGFFGLHVLSAGSTQGEMTEVKGENFMKRFFVKDNLLTGFMLIGNYDRAGILLSLIRERVPLDTVDFKAMTVLPELVFFPQSVRREKLDR